MKFKNRKCIVFSCVVFLDFVIKDSGRVITPLINLKKNTFQVKMKIKFYLLLNSIITEL